MGRGAFLFLGIVIGVVAASIWWNRTAIKAAYTNRDKIRAGLDLAANIGTLTS